ncbi:hypothetical protein [Clostridium sp.]|uniref:hypothetical protein n=1 Tax=Clostridium sp. TaxID=1506 RepID=UPI00284709CA|nr:hypothetical protein [Clostridium sp.]MDR3598027.1 hypothetical protein [Clostridium sp.]
MLFKFIFCNTMGIVCFILGIWQIIFTLNNKNDMPHYVQGLKKEKYEVIDKDKFNNIMVTQSIVQVILILLTGVLYVISKNLECCVLASGSIFPNIIFSIKVRKYIKVE